MNISKIVALLVLVFTTIIVSYGQDTIQKTNTQNHEALNKKQPHATFIAKAKKAGLNALQIKKIQDARIQRDQQLQAGTESRKNRDRKQLVPLYDNTLSKKKIHQRFYQIVAAQMTPEQYQKIFEDQLTQQTTNAANIRLSKLKNSGYTLSQKLQAHLQKRIIAEETQKTWMTHYYGYNKHILKEKQKAYSTQLILKNSELIGPDIDNFVHQAKNHGVPDAEILHLLRTKTTQGLSSATQQLFISKSIPSKKNKAYAYADFMEKAKKAGVSEQSIQLIISKSQKRDEELIAVKNYQRLHAPDILQIKDEKLTSTGVKNKFRKYLSSQLSLGQFQKIFEDKLQEQINSDTAERMATIKKMYNPKKRQYDELYIMMRKQVTKEVVINNYYGYDKQIQKQKLGASQYKFNIIYKQQIKAMVKQE